MLFQKVSNLKECLYVLCASLKQFQDGCSFQIGPTPICYFQSELILVPSKKQSQHVYLLHWQLRGRRIPNNGPGNDTNTESACELVLIGPVSNPSALISMPQRSTTIRRGTCMSRPQPDIEKIVPGS